MTPVQSNQNGESSGTPQATIAVTLNSVGAGNLIAIYVKHEGAATTIDVSDGTSSFQKGTYQSNVPANSHGQWHYLLVANSGNKTYTATITGSRAFPSIFVFETSYSGVASLDAQNTNAANGTAVTSNNFSPTGTDGMAYGGYSENSATTTSAELINGIAADQAIRSPGGNFTSAWRKSYSAGFTGAATATGNDFACCGISFKAVAAASGGLLTIPLTFIIV